jgi:arabinofuranosyltransferase
LNRRIKRVSGFYKKRFIVILILTVVTLVCLAWHNRFIWDDPFILFRYADNLELGKGLVWNEGERVEGYTNFLWTLLMYIPLYLGYGPITFF